MPPCRRPHGTVLERFAPTPAHRLSKNTTKRGTNLCNGRSHGGVHIYCTVLATNSAQNVAFFPHLLSIITPKLQRIGFSFPESSRHQGRFPFSQISAAAVNGTRFVGSSHWKIPRKRGKSKKVGPFSRLEFPNGMSCSQFVPVPVPRSGTATYRGLRPNGTTFYQSEIPLLLPPKFPGFFSRMESAP